MTEEVYEIKRIEFLGKQSVPILLQSKNGPCPLLAIANVLLLSNRLTIAPGRVDIGLDMLVQLVAERLLDSNPLDESITSENRRKAIADAIDVLPSLAKGLDINVRFNKVDSFEFDKNLNVFDMLGISLYHGWVVSEEEEDEKTKRLLQNESYNTLIERVVEYDSQFGGPQNEYKLIEAMDNVELREKALNGQLAQKFLETHAAQLTFTGLTQLHQVVKNGEVCVFFRNNHFSTMFKHTTNGSLYLLCTDAGFKNNSGMCWEILNDIHGDTELCNPLFGDPNSYLSPEDIAFAQRAPSNNNGTMMNLDEELARTLQIQR